MTSSQLSDGGTAAVRVRVLIVDDSDDIRLVLRRVLGRDPRFELVGEATNGAEAIEMAASLKPNLVVLDRHMPVLGGIEAIPDLREAAPAAAIVMFTTQTDATTHQTAVALGAVDVIDKAILGFAFVDELARVLVDHWGHSDDDIEIVVGPVSAAAARVWIPNTARILDAIVAHPEIAGMAVPDDVVATLRGFLESWAEVAEGSDEFRWRALAPAPEVIRLVGYWAEMDLLTDEQLDALGVAWSPPEGEPFFDALTAGVLSALESHEETRSLSAGLHRQWDHD